MRRDTKRGLKKCCLLLHQTSTMNSFSCLLILKQHLPTVKRYNNIFVTGLEVEDLFYQLDVQTTKQNKITLIRNKGRKYRIRLCLTDESRARQMAMWKIACSYCIKGMNKGAFGLLLPMSLIIIIHQKNVCKVILLQED